MIARLVISAVVAAALVIAPVPAAHAAGKHKDKTFAAKIKHSSFPFRCPGPKPC
jgi:hypothetical protein